MKKKNLIIISLSTILLSCGKNKPDIISSINVDMSKNNYYKNGNGKILDSITYLLKRKTQLEKLKKISSSFRLYEKLEKEYERNDSVVYSYFWNFSDNIEGAIEEEKKKMKNLDTTYPIKNSKTLNGKIINIEDLKGKPTLVNLWFIGCKPCIEEMPILNKLKLEYTDRFNFLSVTPEKSEDVKEFLKTTKFNFQHIIDAKNLTTELGFNGFPVNLFLDKNGIIKKIEGNIPYKKNDNDEMVISNGEKFINILKSIE